MEMNDDALAAWLFETSPFELDNALRAARIEIPVQRRADAERIAVRALRASTDQATDRRP